LVCGGWPPLCTQEYPSPVPSVNHVDASELLGAYVLDACGVAESDEIRLHIITCPECTEEIDRLGAVAGFIGATDLEAPPAHLRDDVLDAARNMPPE
jgi:hypothetical protein